MTRSRDLANFADSTEFTAADHTKLDGIEASATADQTTAQIKTAVEAAADIDLDGNPTTTTQSAGNNTTRLATTAFTQAAITALVDSSPASLNTLNELAAALGDDANFSTTVTNSIATKLPLSGGALTGVLTTNSFVGIGVTPSDTFGFGKALDIGSATGAFIYVRDTDATNATGGIGISGTRLYISNKAAGPITFQVNGDATERMRITPTGDVGIGATDPGGSRLYLQDNHTTNVTGPSTLIGNTTFTINGNSGEGSDVMRMGPMSVGGAYFIDVSNGGGSAAYPLLLNPVSGGMVGIGTKTPAAPLHVRLAGSGSVPVTVAKFDTISAAYGRGPQLDFCVYWGSEIPTAKISAPNVSGGNGYGGELRFSTNGNANANSMAERIMVDEDGLKFHGDTAAANGLNDYEEGTFTVSMSGATTSRTNATAVYTKVGNLVTFSYYTRSSSISSTSGYARITGLPFTAKNHNSADVPCTIANNTFFGGSATVGQQAFVAKNSTIIYFMNTGTASQASFVNGSSKYLGITGTYMTA